MGCVIECTPIAAMGQNYSVYEFVAIDNAIKTIMNKGTSEDFGFHPVDEGFLTWVAVTYGKDTLVKLTERLDWYAFTGNSIHVLWDTYCVEKNYMSYNLSNVHWMPMQGQNIDLSFVGDINFDDKWYTMKAAKVNGGVDNCFSSELKALLKQSDVTMVNNEFTFGEKGKALEGKDYTFRAPEENVKYYELLGADIASLANNHVYDYGKDGLLNTKKVLEANNIITVGAGKNLDEASSTVYYNIGGRKIAIVSATQIEKYSHFTKAATAKEAGVFKMLEPALFCRRIAEAKRKSDYVIAYVHWGREGTSYFDWDQENYAKEFALAGADVIIGGHPHRLQGASYIEGVPVVYSLGNFWFSTGSLYTTVAKVNINAAGALSVRMIPCIQKQCKTYILSSEKEVDEFYQYLCDCSKSVGFDENGTLINMPDESIKYRAKSNFVYYTTEVDLDGKDIDIVGNVK